MLQYCSIKTQPWSCIPRTNRKYHSQVQFFIHLLDILHLALILRAICLAPCHPTSQKKGGKEGQALSNIDLLAIPKEIIDL